MSPPQKRGLPLEGIEPWFSAAKVLLAESGCTIRKYRLGLSGTAYTASGDWGIEVPRPNTANSFAVLAHEVAHQMLHRHGSKQRWQQEIEAWDYALRQFDRFAIDIPMSVLRRAHRASGFAVDKAMRRSKDPSALWERVVAYPEQVGTDWLSFDSNPS